MPKDLNNPDKKPNLLLRFGLEVKLIMSGKSISMEKVRGRSLQKMYYKMFINGCSKLMEFKKVPFVISEIASANEGNY